jgi:hypothetical protein
MSHDRRSRRSFLKTTAAAGTLALLSPEEVFALLSGTTFIRPNLRNLTHTSPDIVAYKRGIKAMKALPSTNPLNWNRFANIHGSPSGTGPLWNSCQHGHWWFLPWHRMYLLYFERTIRKLSATPSFALPFWDYSAGASAVSTADNNYLARSIPKIFRSPTASNDLFTSNRGAGINTGGQLSSTATSHTAAFAFTNFTSATGTAANFGSQTVAASSHNSPPHGGLESNPHDAVHGGIGGGMGSFGTAARDPIFWCHHANIDRLWNLWLTTGGGRKDPFNGTWCNKVFTFFNENGVQVGIKVRDVINSLAQLKVKYEGEPAIPTQSCPLQLVLTDIPKIATIQQRTLMIADQGLTLGATPQSMSMRLPAAPVRARAQTAITSAERSLVLRVEGITVDKQPDIIYDVYVGLPAGQKPDPAGPFFVGTLSTFGADHAGPEGLTAAWKIDEAAARALQAKGDTVSVTFVPRGVLLNGREQIQPQGKVTFKRMRVVEE